jgi:hypothetical protein
MKKFTLILQIITACFLLIQTSSIAQEQETDSNIVVGLKHFGDTAMLRDSSAVTVLAKFTVEANGKISSIEILKNNCKTCDDKVKKAINDEVINIIRRNPIVPRKDNKGKAKKTVYTQPFIFKLEEE